MFLYWTRTYYNIISNNSNIFNSLTWCVMFIMFVWGVKLSVYHPGVFIELNKMVFASQTHLYLHLMY
jgi:hypothetical protein